MPLATDPAARTSPAVPPRPTPSIHHRAFLTWVAVYTAITAVQLALGSILSSLPLAVRTLVLTAIVVPAVVYALVPALLRLHATATARRRPSGEPR